MADFAYFWQKQNSTLESYSFQLEIRRLELLESLDAFSSHKDYDQKLIEEWLILTDERDRVFHELHRKSIVRDMNNSILLAYEALKNSLRLSFTLQNVELSNDFRKTVVNCTREIGEYIKEKNIEPVQIILCNESAEDIFLPQVLELKNEEIHPIPEGISTEPCSFEKKVDEWQIRCSTEIENGFISPSPVETQSNATYESCFDSIVVSSVNRKKFGFGGRFAFLMNDNMPSIDLTSKYDQIKEIMNTSFD